MTDSQKLEEIRKIVTANYKPHWELPGEQPDSSWSFGNGDDQFNDGTLVGCHWIAKDILAILDKEDTNVG